jgi:hypothetical protein
MSKSAFKIIICIFSALALWSGWLLWTFGAFDNLLVFDEKSAATLFFGSIVCLLTALVSYFAPATDAPPEPAPASAAAPSPAP